MEKYETFERIGAAMAMELGGAFSAEFVRNAQLPSQAWILAASRNAAAELTARIGDPPRELAGLEVLIASIAHMFLSAFSAFAAQQLVIVAGATQQLVDAQRRLAELQARAERN